MKLVNVSLLLGKFLKFASMGSGLQDLVTLGEVDVLQGRCDNSILESTSVVRALLESLTFAQLLQVLKCLKRGELYTV